MSASHVLADARPVAQTRLRLPSFGLGSAHLGELYARIPEAQSQAVMERAWELGIRYFDTAPWYGRGLAEHRLGQFLRTQRREDFIVNSKVGRLLGARRGRGKVDTSPWVGGLPFEITFDYSYDGVMRAHEQILQRLGSPYVDSLVIHDLDAKFHGEQLGFYQRQLTAGGGLRALEELKSSGDIDAIGLGVGRAGELRGLLEWMDVDFVLMAMPYTLLDQSSLHTDMAVCVERRVGVVIGSPLASGILATGARTTAKYGYKAAPAEIMGKVAAIESICRVYGVDLPAVALQFALAHPAVVSVIPGATRPEEIEQNVASAQQPIPAALWEELRIRGLVEKDAPVPGTHDLG